MEESEVEMAIVDGSFITYITKYFAVRSYIRGSSVHNSEIEI